MRKSLTLIFTLILVAITMPLAVASVREVGKFLGLVPVAVPVIGTGSMYPSLFWETGEGGPDDSSKRVVEEYRTNPHMYRYLKPGITLLGHTFPSHELGIGDLVTFESESTRAILANEGKNGDVGFIKRIVAVSGDTVELRDGYLYRNGEPVEEPYIYRPRSTYGDSFLADCHVLNIPPDSYFVLGDNRKTSADSRGELGLVRDADITFYLPLSQQGLYHSLWRDTSQDAELAGTATLDAAEFYRLLNQARLDHGVNSLSSRASLVRSSTYKAQSLLTGSQLSLADSLSRAGYSNTVTGEFSIRGRFTAEELLQNLLYFEGTAAQVLDAQYDEIGAVALNREVNNCPTEAVVGHLGGYLPPEYDQATRESWQSLLNNLRSVIPDWQEARGVSGVDQAKLEALLSILDRRLRLAEEIVQTMADNRWLTDSQQDRIEQDKFDSAEANRLSQELNSP